MGELAIGGAMLGPDAMGTVAVGAVRAPAAVGLAGSISASAARHAIAPAARVSAAAPALNAARIDCSNSSFAGSGPDLAALPDQPR
jgi:hypothetical protein